MELPRSSPARLTALATLKLPRWGIFALCILYIGAGLVGRDPWKSEDAVGFGAMWTMANGSLHDWLIPNIAGATLFDSGPLMYWVGAASIRMFRGLFGAQIDAALAARLSTVVFFLIASRALWYATFILGRRPTAQPLALAFGGHPEPRDYGRTLADGALLILLATLGLVTRAHECSSDVAMLAMLCLTLYAMARSLEQAEMGAIWMSVSLTGLGLTRGPYPVVALAVAWTILVFVHTEWRRSRLPLLYLTVPLTACGLMAWPLAVQNGLSDGPAYVAARIAHWSAYRDGISLEALRHYGKNLPWLTLPGWPIAAWAIWSWRREASSTHIILPVTYLLAMLAVMLVTSDLSDGLSLMLLPGIVMLAAFGLPTLKRGASNAIDWFSVLIYSLTGLALWVSWFTRMTGFPHQYAQSIARQVPGFQSSFHVIPFLIAVSLSVTWVWLVRWRISTHPKMLWRSVVLASAGLILCWSLTMSLWINELNYSRTYRDVAQRLAEAAPLSARTGQVCVATEDLGLAQRASFTYFSKIRFARLSLDQFHEEERCPYLLRQDHASDPRSDRLSTGHWQLIWEGRRVSDREESYRLYQRKAEHPGSPAPATSH